MDQIHRRSSTDHVRNLLRGYTEGLLVRPAIEETLGIERLVVLENTEPIGIQHIDCWLKVRDPSAAVMGSGLNIQQLSASLPIC
jgi:hypothetical protein